MFESRTNTMNAALLCLAVCHELVCRCFEPSQPLGVYTRADCHEPAFFCSSGVKCEHTAAPLGTKT